MSSKEVMKLLREHGWVFVRIRGSHHLFVKPGKNYHITLPHPEKDLAAGTLRKIMKLIN
ncbi:type II toxin-antitoxin system HicA family toxin [Pantoea piersonii]|uniref:type II toxin-antitoxin system HicA family toxin n=1 Tax=Pantoea piersonii TaxID=2364647 RepID=UPI0022F187A8|nr:type II toxin-antitoxin system HicA family toxin [Pantoea piersonii]WBV22833.1 type II toxin-antitoxin system HicA family toxin [Pantoea piersonii]